MEASIEWTDWNQVVEKLARSFDPAGIDNLFNPFPPAEALQEPGKIAFEQFTNQVPMQVSLANFLYELRDIKGLIPKIQGSLTKSANGAFLGYEFGIKPFLKDLKKIRGSLDAVLRRMRFLSNSFGKPTRIHYIKLGAYDHPLVGVRNDPDPSSVLQDLQWVLTSHKADFRASATLYHRLKDLDGALSFLSAFSAAFGFNRPASIVWEAIPYSFVVDWFLDLQSRLDSMASQPFEGVWELSDVVYSINSFSLIDGWIWPRRNFGNSWNHVYRIRRKAYRREVGLPVPRASLGTLTDMQQVLLGSLLYQRFGKH
jgi:hypothetical protein